jgi:predicted dehydrogenase
MQTRVAIVGAGRMGQEYALAYAAFPETTVVAFVDPNEQRTRAVCELHPGSSWYPTVEAMCAAVKPDVVSVVTPAKYMKDAVIAAAVSPGIQAVQCDKPFGGPLADCDEMVQACADAGVIFAGGNLQRAMGEVQHAAGLLRSGQFGNIVGAAMHSWQGEILGGGCQHVAVLRLLADAEVSSVTAWFDPAQG